MENKFEYIQISTTVAKKADAERITKVLLDRNLSACTQIVGPIMSTYLWKGEIQRSREWICIVKTDKKHYKAVEKAIQEIHSYELPEIIATPIILGSRKYLRWIRTQIQDEK